MLAIRTLTWASDDSSARNTGPQTGMSEVPCAGVRTSPSFVTNALTRSAGNVPPLRRASSVKSGGGTLSGTTTVATNASGVAAFDDLVITGSNGSRTLIFAAANYTPAVSAPVVVAANPGPSPQYTTAHVPGGRLLRWTTIRITTRDYSGNDLHQGGYASLIKVSVAGANTNSSLTIFDQGNGDYTASYFPVFKGTDTITITIGGVPIKGSPYQSKVK